MAPAARLTLPAGTRLPTISIAPARFRVQGWDPLLIISQIVALQALHYLTLALILPSLLATFASSTLLAYEGGPSSVSIVMDWREFSGQPTTSVPTSRHVRPGLLGLGAMASKAAARNASESIVSAEQIRQGLVRVLEYDPMRGWAVAFAWSLTALIDVFYLYHLVRRPTHILDSSLTLIFNHLILTTYYSSHFPSSFFFWFVIASSTIAQIVIAEQWCVRREMQEGFQLDGGGGGGAPPSSTNPNLNQATPSMRNMSTPDLRRSRQTSLPQDVKMGKIQSGGGGKHATSMSLSGAIGAIGASLSPNPGGGGGGGGAGYERVPMKDKDEDARS